MLYQQSPIYLLLLKPGKARRRRKRDGNQHPHEKSTPIPCSRDASQYSSNRLHASHTLSYHLTSTKDYENYIQTACKPTLYRKLCYQSLSPYALKIKGDPQTFCKTALTMTLQAARNASSTISKQLKQKGLTKLEGQVIKNCDSNIKDSIDELQQSLNAMKLLSGPDRAFQLDNIKTWVSAALTDDTTCTDEFDQEGQKVRATIKNKIRNMVSNIALMTSNALALVNNQLK